MKKRNFRKNENWKERKEKNKKKLLFKKEIVSHCWVVFEKKRKDDYLTMTSNLHDLGTFISGSELLSVKRKREKEMMKNKKGKRKNKHFKFTTLKQPMFLTTSSKPSIPLEDISFSIENKK